MPEPEIAIAGGHMAGTPPTAWGACAVCAAPLTEAEVFQASAPLRGMWLCRGCVQRHRGSYWVSEPERDWQGSPAAPVLTRRTPFEVGRLTGIEFEMRHKAHNNDRVYDLAAAWELAACGMMEDGSIQSEAGIEIKTPPADAAMLHAWIEAVCTVCRGYGMVVDKSCGLHVHVAFNPPADRVGRTLAQLVRLAKAAEPMIYAMLPGSRWNNSYAAPMQLGAGDLVGQRSRLQITKMWHLPKNGGTSRYKGLNLEALSKYGTIEFRYHSGTLNAEKVINWVRVCQALVRVATETKAADVPTRFTDAADRHRRVLALLGLADLTGYVEARTALFRHDLALLEKWASSLDLVAPLPPPGVLRGQEDDDEQEPVEDDEARCPTCGNSSGDCGCCDRCEQTEGNCECCGSCGRATCTYCSHCDSDGCRCICEDDGSH